MKIGAMILTLFAVALSFAPQFVSSSSAASGTYSVRLIAPVAGQVVYPGQKIMIEWKHSLPDIPLPGCESEAWLSLDGGITFSMWVTFLDPRSTSFLWTVPDTPTNAAVFDIRFGCDLHYPESYAPQPASMFRISKGTGSPY